MASSRTSNTFNCAICMSDFNDPRLLPCFHTFCRRCLDEVIATSYKDGSFTCPLCEETVTVPRNGTKGLPVNSFLERDNGLQETSCDVCDEKRKAVSKCRECDQNFCNRCSDVHERMQGTTSHSVYPVASRLTPRLPFCKQHVQEKLEYFCEICEMIVCQVCIKFSHKSHPIQDVSSVADTLKDEIMPLLKKSGSRYSSSEDYKLQVAKQQKKIRTDEENVMESIDKQTTIFKDVVDDVRSDFIRQLLEAISDCNSELKDNKDIVSKNCAAVDNLIQFAKIFIRNANDCDVIKYGLLLKHKLDNSKYGNTGLLRIQKIEFIPKEVTMNDIKKLFGFFTPAKYDFVFTGGVNIVQTFHCSLEDCTITSMTFMPDSTLWICLGNNGVLERYSYTGLKKAEIRLEHRIDAITSDSRGILYVTCNAEKKIITFNKKNAYKREHFIDTELYVRGIAMDENDCLIVGLTQRDVFFGSRYPQMGYLANISADKDVEKLHIDDITQYPARVAINNAGAIAVSDWIGLCVMIFRRNRKVGYFNGKGRGYVNFFPRGICSTNDDNFIVVDTANNCLHWISEDGNLQRTVEGKSGLGEPYCVTVDEHGNVWIGTKDGRVVQLSV